VICLNYVDLRRQGLVRPGQWLLFASAGIGFTWGVLLSEAEQQGFSTLAGRRRPHPDRLPPEPAAPSRTGNYEGSLSIALGVPEHSLYRRPRRDRADKSADAVAARMGRLAGGIGAQPILRGWRQDEAVLVIAASLSSTATRRAARPRCGLPQAGERLNGRNCLPSPPLAPVKVTGGPGLHSFRGVTAC
jgi:hypothetical protein